MSKWKDGTQKSTNNAFTGFTNSIDWTALNSPIGAIKGGLSAARKNGTPVYLPNSEQLGVCNIKHNCNNCPNRSKQ